MTSEVLTISAARVNDSVCEDQSGSLRDFVIGPENGLLIESLVRPVLDRGDVEFAPIFIHGPTSSGKSHLIHLLATHLASDVILADAHSFSADCTEAMKIDELNSLVQRHLQATCLFFDDIDQLADKPAAAGVFALILEERSRREQLTVATAKRPPYALKLPNRLISRLSEGVVVPLEHASQATREKALVSLAGQIGLRVDRKTIKSLAKSDESIASLINRIQRLSLGDATLDDQYTNQTSKQHTTDLVDPANLIRVTAKYYGVRIQDVTGASRRKQPVMARFMAMHLLRSLTQLSYQQIGRLFGKRDHSSVLHGCRKISKLIQSEGTVQEAESDILKLLTKS